jgi:RNA polymerase sigma-70 factor (ECF subfamily)
MDAHLEIFRAERRRLAGLAYRMTGSLADAEDILQRAWIRFSREDTGRLESPSSWLGAVVTRLCLDDLKSARRRRETYVGAWLPEPLVEDWQPGADQSVIRGEDVSIALVLALETLGPEMRAAFILRDAFDFSFEEIGEVVGRSPASCRQLVSRARRRLAGAEPPDSLPETGSARSREVMPILSAFWQASRDGDLETLLSLFSEDIEFHSDGGGVVPAAINVLKGPMRTARFLTGMARKFPHHLVDMPRLRRINGAPGWVMRDGSGVLQTTAFEIRNGRISAIWVMRNPQKLRHLEEV